MQEMIQNYEKSRSGLQQRIRELNEALRDDTLMHREREHLIRRRDILNTEATDLLHIITDLREHCA